MRNLDDCVDPDILSSKVFSVLQLCATSEPLLPNLKTLQLRHIGRQFIPLIRLVLSPRTTFIGFTFDTLDLSEAMVASTLATLPTLCPNLQDIDLDLLPRDPVITASVSGILLASNRSALRRFQVDSPLTEEAREVVCKLPNLRKLSVVIEKGVSLPSAVLPNLTKLVIKYDHDSDLLQVFCGATLERLKSVTFHSRSEQIGDFLEALETVGFVASTQNTLSKLYFYTSCPWDPNYSSLLAFTQLTKLVVEFPCDFGCSSRVDDDIIINLARTMPKLEILQLGDIPCREIPIGVTIKGLVVLARHCPDLTSLFVHFQVASLSTPPGVSFSTFGPTPLRRDCALGDLVVGEIPILEESVFVVALTLTRIFPRLENIEYTDENWEKVLDVISASKQIIDYTGKKHPLYIP